MNDPRDLERRVFCICDRVAEGLTFHSRKCEALWLCSDCPHPQHIHEYPYGCSDCACEKNYWGLPDGEER